MEEKLYQTPFLGELSLKVLKHNNLLNMTTNILTSILNFPVKNLLSKPDSRFIKISEIYKFTTTFMTMVLQEVQSQQFIKLRIIQKFLM